MFLHLTLAHFLGDYPLQSGWIARNKHRSWVLPLHVLIHFVVLLAVTFPASRQIWPALLALTAIHYTIDRSKIRATRALPARGRLLYFVDQAVHLLVLLLASLWIHASWPEAAAALPRSTAVVALGFVLLTFAYRITEYVVFGSAPITPEIPAQTVGRPVVRAALLALFLLAGNAFAALAWVMPMPYPATRAGMRVLLRDVLAAFITALVVTAINRWTG